MDELARFRLDGRVALVAGGSGGIGVRICAALAGVGARVAVVGRSADGWRRRAGGIEDAARRRSSSRRHGREGATPTRRWTRPSSASAASTF